MNLTFINCFRNYAFSRFVNIYISIVISTHFLNLTPKIKIDVRQNSPQVLSEITYQKDTPEIKKEKMSFFQKIKNTFTSEPEFKYSNPTQEEIDGNNTAFQASDTNQKDAHPEIKEKKVSLVHKIQNIFISEPEFKYYYPPHSRKKPTITMQPPKLQIP